MLVALALTGCGGGGGTTGSGEGTGATSVDAAPPGLTATAWPGRLAGAGDLLERLPRTVSGMTMTHRRLAGDASRSVIYASKSTNTFVLVLAPSESHDDPTETLSYDFGSIHGCHDGTYAGSAPQSEHGGGPDVDDSGTIDTDSDLWWFACEYVKLIDPSEPVGHVVGWVSGDLAWLVQGNDGAAVEAVMQAFATAV